ncbi:MAG: site-specific integrase [Rickettsiales bacterium]|nr:site-specific integrase [Rickettsiales bacterium]
MYLHKDKKSGIYKYRREYPADLVAVIGKKWFIRTLNTKDVKVANERTDDAKDEYNNIVNQHKVSQYVISSDSQKRLLQLLKPYRVRPVVENSKTLSYSELMLARGYASNQIKTIYKKMALEGEDVAIFAILGLNNNASAKTALPVWKNIFLQIENALRDARGEERAVESDCEALLADLGIEPFNAPATPLQTHVNQNTQVISNPKHSIVLSEAFEFWKESEEERRDSKYISDTRYAVKRFIELFNDKRIVDITRDDMEEYVKNIKKLPVIHSFKVRNQKIQELFVQISKGEIDDSDKLSSRTIKKMVSQLQSVITVATSKYKLGINNPASGLRLKVTPKYKRCDFSNDDLKKLFNSPLYRGYGDYKRKEAGNAITRDAFYWLPLVGLYTGARSEEIAQLRISDIKVMDGITYLHLNTIYEDQSLKNDNSKRNVPIHNELVKLGFLDYIKGLSGGSKARVFPEQRWSPSEERYSKYFSKDFNDYLKFLDIKPPRNELLLKDFHSFRHTFKTACRVAKVVKAEHDRLTGHNKPQNDSGEDYGEHPFFILEEAMQKVKYPELDLSHLYVKNRKPETAPIVRKKKKKLVLVK